MIVTAKLLDASGVPFTGAVVAKSTAGVALSFRPQAGRREWSKASYEISDGVVELEVWAVSDAIIAAADGSCALRYTGGAQYPVNLGADTGSVSVSDKYTGSVGLTSAGEYLAISGELTALASATANCCTLTHIPASDRTLIVAVEGVLAAATLNTSGGVVLASAPSEGDVVEFLGTTII